MKKSLFLLFLILNVNLIFGQSVKVFDGLIDKYPIQVFLNYHNSYCYACGTLSYFLDFSKLKGLLKDANAHQSEGQSGDL